MNFNDIINLFRQGKATAKSHMRNLIEIAVADGGFGIEEQRLLEYAALRNNISKSQLKIFRPTLPKFVSKFRVTKRINFFNCTILST